MINKTYCPSAVHLQIPDGMDGVVDVDEVVRRAMVPVPRRVRELLAAHIVATITCEAERYVTEKGRLPDRCYLTQEQLSIVHRTHPSAMEINHAGDVSVKGMAVEIIPSTKQPLTVGE